MEKELIPIVIFMVLFVSGCLFALAAIYDVTFETSGEQLCQEIGYEGYEYYGGKSYCMDNADNGYSMTYECEGRFWNKVCKARIITIGDVRTQDSQKVKE